MSVSADISDALLQRIWDKHLLGEIRAIATPERGVINACRIVNDAYVIRFDTLDYADLIRYKGERIAYELLRGSGVPVPDVIALDSTKTLAPYCYLILTKLDGTPIIDAWHELSLEERGRVARAAGKCLALIHECRFDGFGVVKTAKMGNLPRWYDYVRETLDGDTEEAIALGLIDKGMAEKLKVILTAHRSVLEIGTRGRLVHGDYQFENLLQRDADLTGVIDFEWMRSGDPAWDFRLEDLWEDTCPGSRTLVYEGYANCRMLTEDHNLRVQLYKMLLYLNDLLFYGDDQPDPVAYRRSQERLGAVARALEG